MEDSSHIARNSSQSLSSGRTSPTPGLQEQVLTGSGPQEILELQVSAIDTLGQKKTWRPCGVSEARGEAKGGWSFKRSQGTLEGGGTLLSWEKLEKRGLQPPYLKGLLSPCLRGAEGAPGKGEQVRGLPVGRHQRG